MVPVSYDLLIYLFQRRNNIMAGKRVMMIGLDGADPFVIKKLINQGRLPNIKRAIKMVL